MFGKPIEGLGMAGHVGYLLGEINENEAKYDRPMLSAVVIGKNNYPGPGFYAFAEENLGKLQSNATEEQRTSFFKKELDKVYSTWESFINLQLSIAI